MPKQVLKERGKSDGTTVEKPEGNERPGNLFKALVSQAQLSIFIQITPVLLCTGVQRETQAEEEGTKHKQKVRKTGGIRSWEKHGC